MPRRRKVIPPMPPELVGKLLWLIVYHWKKLLGVIALVGSIAFMIFCFHCSGELWGFRFGVDNVKATVEVQR